MSAEHVDIEIDLSSKFWNNAPRAKVWLDDTVLLQASELTQPTKVTYSGQLEEGEHEIRISLHGKDGVTDTVIEDGKIVKDQILNIDEITFDGIPLGFLLHSVGEFKSDSGEVTSNMVNLGVNGTWTMKFTAPIYLWLLEHL